MAESPKKTGINFHNFIAVRVALVAAGAQYAVGHGAVSDSDGISALWQVVILVAGGFDATYQYSRRTGESLSVSAGARMGLVNGHLRVCDRYCGHYHQHGRAFVKDGAVSAFRKTAEN